MRNLSLLALVVLTTASPVPSILLQPRQAGNSLTASLTAIGNAVDATSALVTGWDGKAATFDRIQQSTTQISAALKDGTAKTTAGEVLGIVEAALVVPGATTLDGKVGTLMNNLVAKKGAFDSAGKSSAVKTILQGEKTNAQAFIAAINSKMPLVAGPIAGPITNGFITKLDGALSTFR